MNRDSVMASFLVSRAFTSARDTSSRAFTDPCISFCAFCALEQPEQARQGVGDIRREAG